MKEVCPRSHLVVINDAKLCKTFDVPGGTLDTENTMTKFLAVTTRSATS